jgi:hypothetical protein
MTSYSSTTDPYDGSVTPATFSNTMTPTRFSYTSRSGSFRFVSLCFLSISFIILDSSSDTADASSARHMRRITVSPSPSIRNSDPYNYDYNDDDVNETAEVEAALNDLDNELDDTEETLAHWSRNPNTNTGRTQAMGTGSFTSPPPTYTPEAHSSTTTQANTDTNTGIDRDWRILSTISERTENPSRPTSHSFSPGGVGIGVTRPANPTPDALRRSTALLGGSSPHTRSSTDPGSGVGPLGGRRAGDLIAFFEDRTATATSSDMGHGGHTRSGSAPGGPRSPSPYVTGSRSTPDLGGTTTGTGYGYGSTTGYGTRPSSSVSSGSGTGPSTWASPTTITRGGATSDTVTSRVRSPFTTTGTSDTGYLSPSTYTNTFTNTFSNTNTFTGTNTGSITGSGSLTPTGAGSLRRPQTSPRSPLTSVRNIVAAWKERTPTLVKSGGRSGPGSATSGDAEATSPQGLFSIRRRGTRVRDAGAGRGGDGGEGRERDVGRSGRAGGGGGERGERPSTPLSESMGAGAGGVPPPFDAAELGAYARESREVSYVSFWDMGFLLGVITSFRVLFAGRIYQICRSVFSLKSELKIKN